jgi:diguanylate cyclase
MAAMRKLLLSSERVTESDIDSLHVAHLSSARYSNAAERTSENILTEISSVMEMVDLALGSTSRYGESLEQFSSDLSAAVDRNAIRDIVKSLVLSTRDVSSTNRTLEARLKETRNEIEILRESLEVVRVESLTDPLTGIANRKHFEEMLIKSIDHASVQRTPLCIIVLDIDRFKTFNDTYGHLTGDQVIRLVAQAMKDNVKNKATPARFGGEEFAIILPETVLDTAYTIAETVRKAVMARDLVKRSTGESLGRVTISLGIAIFHKGDTAMTLLERADQCMYAAKNMGRNCTMTEEDIERIERGMDMFAEATALSNVA